jgi:hypothetical protein
LITTLLSPPLREDSDRNTVEQKIMYTFALVLVLVRNPSSHQGDLSCPDPVPPLSGGATVSATGALPGIKTGWWSLPGVLTRRKNTLKIRRGEIL